MDWNREGKQAARQYLLDNISFEEPIKYIGLPAARAIFERQLYYKFDVESFHLFEKDPEVFSELARNLEEFRFFSSPSRPFSTVSLYPKSINDFKLYTSDLEDFNFAWFDYCGPITTPNLLAMFSSFNTFLKNGYKKGYLAFTFMIGRENPIAMDMINDFAISSDESNLSEAYLKRISFLRILISNYCKKKGFGYNLKFFSYRDGAPMILLLLEFKNSKKKTVTIEELFVPSAPSRLGRPSIPVIINGDYYFSIKAASEALLLSSSSITSRLKDPFNLNFQYA